MKKVSIFVLLFQVVTLASFAQTDTTKIEQYCQIIVTPRLMSNKVTIDIDFGEEKSIWSDSRVRTYDESPAYKAVNIQRFQFLDKNAISYLAEEGFLPTAG